MLSRAADAKLNLPIQRKHRYVCLQSHAGSIHRQRRRIQRPDGTYHAANLRLRQEKAALTAQYPDQWVGVDVNGLVAVAPTSQELADRLREMNLLGDAVATGFMATKPKLMIL